MSPAILSAAAMFGFVTSITPGPNNMMLLASGLNFGVRRTIPHMLGISIGYVILMLAVGFGLGEALRSVPHAFLVLKLAGGAYMLWLAWQIARSAPPRDAAAEAGEAGAGAARRPMSALQAAAFQWVNPKAWVIVVTAVATYVSPDELARDLLIVTLICGLINLPSISVWAVFGAGLRRFLSDPGWRRIFNVTMAVLLVLSLWPLFATAIW
ncbi:Threonine/homoserine/homoserine lactone efflux protein [Rhizobiales bacterium GAS113]|jgi:threonine/homoserine/homoserine lactone efflux protein|nr:Threonine/homoserine/homoserine lactone efflux protein [Rhizobiales bacterium GAS113]SED53494.1 Threonine/homoserine/homoserine lactone efflux protein [Rhizobiales bacterium GAS188]